MLMKFRVRALLVIALFCALCAVWSTVAQAVPVSFTIDPSQSFLAVGPGTSLLGVGVKAQVAGSDTDSYSGTIAADETGGVLTFSGGSAITAALNPAGPPPYMPNAHPGTDNYGIVTVAATPLGVLSAALRNTALDITTGTVSDGTVPAGMNLEVLPGAFGDITLFGAAGTDGAGANSTSLTASLTTAGGVETLVLPITRITGTSAHFELIGMLVATRAVPEPSTIVLVAVGVFGLLCAGWRKRSK